MDKLVALALAISFGTIMGQNEENVIEKQLSRSFRPRSNAVRPYVGFVAPDLQNGIAAFADADPLACFSTVDVYDGDEYVFQTANFPEDSPVRRTCLWRFNIKANVNADIMCEVFDVPCSSGNRLLMYRSRRSRRLCSSTPRQNQRIRIRTRSRAFRLSLLSVMRSRPSGRLSCTLRGMGGESRPGAGADDDDNDNVSDGNGDNGSQTQPPSNENDARGNCGVALTNRISTKIINGQNANANEYPWAAYLVLGRASCGGSVINNKWVMTAAHCSSNVGNSRINVYLGCHTLTSNSCDRPRPVNRNVIHPQYNSRSLQNDISLLRLSNEVNFNSRVAPVCLPTANVPSGYNMVTAGWGRTRNGGSGSRILKEAQVRSISDSQCRRFFRINNSVLCVNSVTGSTCQGDSGGFLGSRRNGRYEIDGITSFGSARGCGISGIPDGFTEVRAFLNWINSVAN